MIEALAEAVVGLQLPEHGGQAPVLGGMQLLQDQGVGGAVLETEGRFAFERSALGHLHGAGAEGVAVVQVLVKAEVAFAVVGEADEEPRDVERLADGFVAGAVVGHAAGQGADGGERAGVEAAGLEQAQVVGAQGGGEFGGGHGVLLAGWESVAVFRFGRAGCERLEGRY